MMSYDPFIGQVAGAIGGIAQSSGATKVAAIEERAAGTQAQAGTLRAVLAYRAQQEQTRLQERQQRRRQHSLGLALIVVVLLGFTFLIVR